MTGINALNVNYEEEYIKSAPEIIFNSKMSRKKIYWISQISGWVFFSLINVIVIATFDSFALQRALVWLYLCVIGISFTHIFRSFIKKWNWLSLPLKKVIPRVIVASILIGSIMFGLLFLINFSSGAYDMTKFKTAAPFIGVFNLSSVILLWALIYFSVHYFENYKRAEIESYIWEAAVKDYELKTLKSQLNPHFMFNAMNSIRALIEEDPDNAKTALTKLSNILRYSLKIERNEVVPLEEEMQTVADYLALESIRFEERLRYELKIDPASAKIEIPPMMIQTLVENGIKHGISKITEGGKISVCSFISDSELHIKIINTGNIDQEIKKTKGFGIDNTKHRLNLLYGEKAKFTIRQLSGEVVAELILPAIRQSTLGEQQEV